MREEVGHIRLRSEGTSPTTVVEMWNGSAWTALLGVMAVSYEVSASSMGEREGLGLLKLLLWPHSVLVDLPQDQVIMREAPDTLETSG